MVKTRSGKTYKMNVISKKKKNTTVSNSSSSSNKPYRYPNCERHPKGGVMCAACVRAGHTKESYQAYYDKYSKSRPMPRKSTGGKAPRKQLARFSHATVAPPQRRKGL